MLWKMDVVGAFMLVWMRPEDCYLLGCEMIAGLVLLMFAGMFGLTIMPYEVVTRVIRVLMARVVKGLPPPYVRGRRHRGKQSADVSVRHGGGGGVD